MDKNFERIMIWVFVSIIMSIIIGFYLVKQKQDKENWSSKGVVIKF